MSAVSVIIPCYNYGPYLKSALEGLLRQSFQDFEVRVVNDGSTDDTERIAAAFTERFGGRLHYVYQSNRGVSAARNRALKDAAGRYVLFLDADDVLDGAALGTFAAYLDAHPEYGMVYSNTEYFDSESGRTLGLNHGKGPLEKTPHTGLCADKLFTEGNFIPTMSSMFRREVFDKVGVFDETIRYGEDYELWMRITSFFQAGYIDRVLCRVRRHGSNMTFHGARMARYHIRIVKRILRFSPLLREKLTKAQINDKWYEVYYALGLNLALEGRQKRARVFLERAWRIHPDPFRNKIVLYRLIACLPAGWSAALRRQRQKSSQVYG